MTLRVELVVPDGKVWSGRAGGQGRTPGPETRAVFRMALP